MKKILLLTVYGIGAFLFARFFSVSLYYILAILFFGGLAVLIFSGRWPRQEPVLKDMFWLLSSFLWLANIFGFLAMGLNFTLGIFLAFMAAFLILLGGLPVSFRLTEAGPVRGRRRVFIYGFTGAFIIAEFFWAAAFLPFGYLTLAGLVFIVFYLIWTIFYHYLQENLNREIIFKNLAFGAALFAVLLLSAKWQP